MAGDQADNAVDDLDLSGAADQIATLLDEDEKGERDGGARHSAQSEDQSGEDGSDERGADEDSQEQDEGQPETLTVKINGEESQVTLDELVKGYQRNADYTRKTQQLAEVRRESQSEYDAVRQERAKYAQLLQVLDTQLAEGTREPNWDELRMVDPVGYATQWAHHQQLQQQRQSVRAEQQRLAQRQMLDDQTRLREHVEGEAQLLVDAIPAWKDDAKAKAERTALIDYGQKQGFSLDELNNVYDHRAVAILHKAWKYDQAVAQRNNARVRVEAAPARVLVPGKGNAGTRVHGVATAKQRLAQSGSVDDAAALFERLL